MTKNNNNSKKNSKHVSDKKRRYKDRGGSNNNNNNNSNRGNSSSSKNSTWVRLLNNPKRGAPAILMTCEQGKERKCQREGLEIINHYYSRMVVEAAIAKKEGDENQSAGDGDGKQPQNEPRESSLLSSAPPSPPLSLEEELKQLQSSSSKGPQSDDSKFGIFETGCRGTVFALCTVPGSEMIPPIKAQKKSQQPDTNNKDTSVEESNETSDEPEAKKQRTDQTTSPSSSSSVGEVVALEATAAADSTVATTATGNPEWDPVPIVRQIFQDAENDAAKDAPSSRFVTRMIPIQATCFASEEEIQIASRCLMRQYLPSTTTTFAVALKRRFCPGQLTKDKIINTVAAEVARVIPKVKVSLDNPDVTIVVEICKTMCGISVIPKCNEYFRNFNLAVARDEHNQGGDDIE